MMNAKKAREIFNNLNNPLILEDIIIRDINKGFSGTSVAKMNEDDPKLKKLKTKGYLISHTNSNTYITWVY